MNNNNGNIPWVKTGELNHDWIYDTEEKITEAGMNNSSARLFPVNTVIVTMYGATIGKTAILAVPATTNQACACFVCKAGLIYNYLYWYFISQKENLIKSSKGGAQPNISQTILKQYYISLPTIPEQHEIVRLIDDLLARERAAQQAAEQALASIDLMKKSILARAFRGELGTNKASEASALELLRQVLAEN